MFRRRLLTGAIALLIPVLAGCEAGLNAPTLEFHEAGAGAYKVVNDVRINNAFVLGPPSGSILDAGSSASLFMGLFNGSSSDDKLVSASAPGTAQSVTITNGSVNLPQNASANLTGPEPELVLSGLSKPLSGGESVLVNLTFQQAGPVQLEVPVEPQSYYYSQYSQAATPVPTATATPQSGPTPAGSPGATSPGAVPSSSASATPSPSRS